MMREQEHLLLSYGREDEWLVTWWRRDEDDDAKIYEQKGADDSDSDNTDGDEGVNEGGYSDIKMKRVVVMWSQNDSNVR